MPSEYRIEIVSSKKFDSIVKDNPRYEHAGDSLGFADPKNRVAYVLNTQWADLNRYLIDHEFEHLLDPKNKVHMDEHGVHHKKGREIISNIVQPVLTLVGGVIGSAVPGLGTATGAAAGSTLGGAIGGATAGGRGVGRQALKGAGVGALSGAGGAALGAGGSALKGGLGAGVGQAVGAKTIQGQPTGQAILSGVSQGAAFGGGLSGFRPSAPTPTAPPGIKQLSGGSSITSPQQGRLLGQSVVAPQSNVTTRGAAGALGQVSQAGGVGGTLNRPLLTQPLAPTSSFPGGIGPAGGGAPQPPGFLQQAGQAAKNVGKTALGAFGVRGGRQGQGGVNLPAIGTGLALAGGAGSAFGPQAPSVPNLRQIPSIEQLGQTATQAQTPLGEAARVRLGERLGSQFEGVRPEVTAQINRTFDEQRRQLESQFKQFRPNADLATDSGLRRAVFDLENRRAEALGSAEQTEFERFQEQQRLDIAAGLGVDQATLAQLVNLANLDIQQIMTQLGLEAQEAAEFKTTFGQLGSLFVQQGLGLNSFGAAPAGGV